ncbi:Transcriptional regulator, TetR family [Halanaerobium saccharolyticum subsp. saccharolyticum DSM 6643]|uniref:Transcriptional regulator, TetR family n=1 Tax=Halanaerobium saccharolyticum subsp. saccharolyticum DSM 6643 TaxID=1293054 RepID=M5E2F1_9FIRM|nr:TetR/AcrR family transcriptional regulator [Halanaerobium saccharolyticum]CCU80187.1 Transcriptional regulator, TetR family [Halanaerobium saccharolyticum subsp. saccharolyticum DSM 6643]
MADRREEIIQAGIEIFAAKGYYNTHIAEIVESVGIAKGTFYLYFNSKNDLFISLIRRFEDIFLELFEIDILVAETEDLKSFFSKLLKKIFSLYKEHKNLSIIILREAVAVNEKFREEFKEMDARRFKRINNLYQFLLDNDYLNQEIDYDYFVCVFVGIMESIVMRRLLLSEQEFNVEEAADKASLYLENAIKK